MQYNPAEQHNRLMKESTKKRISGVYGLRRSLRSAFLLIVASFSLILLTSQVSTHEHLSGPYLGQSAPGITPERFAQGIIPDDLHSVPVFTSDGNQVYYKSFDGDDIMQCSLKDGAWSKPRPLFLNDETENSDDPCLTPDGKRLFFSTYSKTDNREYILFSKLDHGEIGKPVQPAGKLNETDPHWQFSLAANGNLYYAANGNIYLSVYNNGEYQEPLRLDTAINTPYGECTPWISPDEKVLIFSRSETDKPDLFISHKNKAGEWQTAIPLPSSINTEHHELCPRLTGDGRYFFFLSNREGLFSAYWVDAKVLKLDTGTDES